MTDLRNAGWVFEVNGVDSKWYEYWTLFGELSFVHGRGMELMSMVQI